MFRWAAVFASLSIAAAKGDPDEEECLLQVRSKEVATGCWEPYCGDQYPCGKFQLIEGLPCCDHPDYEFKSGFDSWWTGQAYAEPVAQTALPILVFDTLGKNPSCDHDKVETNVFIIYDATGAPNTITGDAVEMLSSENTKIRIAGQSSRGFAKKQFNIYLDDGGSILGMPKQEDYRAQAPWQDRSALKNWLTLTMVRCNGAWSPRMQAMRAYLVSRGPTGEYGPRDMGLYWLMEKIERGREKLDIASKSCDTAPDCGYLIEIDRYCTQADPGSCLAINSCVGVPVEIQYPKNPTSEQWHFMQNYINKMCDNAHSDKLFDYIDAESFYDQFVYTQVSMNVDSYISSEYVHKTQGGKIKAGPQWDFNLAYGDNYEKRDVMARTGRDPEKPDFGWFRNGNNPSEPLKTLGSLQPTFGWEKFLQNQKFVDGLICHYKNLRAFNMTDDRVMAIIDEGHAWLKLEGAADSFLTDIDKKVSELKTWTKARLAWMDANIDNYKLGLSSACPEYTPPSEEELLGNCQMPKAGEPLQLKPSDFTPMKPIWYSPPSCDVCDCGWTHGGAYCGNDDGSHCYSCCCREPPPPKPSDPPSCDDCDCGWTHGGAYCGNDDGSRCYSCCCRR